MPRQKIYADTAARMRAYRLRKKQGNVTQANVTPVTKPTQREQRKARQEPAAVVERFKAKQRARNVTQKYPKYTLGKWCWTAMGVGDGSYDSPEEAKAAGEAWKLSPKAKGWSCRRNEIRVFQNTEANKPIGISI